MTRESVVADSGQAATTTGTAAQAEAARSHVDSMHFLVFALHGQRYGVDVAEIEAIVQVAGLRQHDGGVSYEGEGLLAVHSLDRWIGLAAEHDMPADQAPAADAPHHLLLSRSGRGLHGLLVDMPRDIVSLPLEAIYALPPLIRHLLPDSPLWGVGRAEDGLILLVDPAGRGRGVEREAPGTGSGTETEREAEAEL
jgi:chemotaxis signal transduction protein